MIRPEETRFGRTETLLFGIVVVWAANYTVAKAVFATMHFLVFNALRFWVAAATLAVLFPLLSTWTPVTRTNWKRLLHAGIVANVVSQVAFVGGLSLTSAGNASVLLATSPLWTALISARMHNEQVGRSMIAGMVFSLAGIGLLMIGTGQEFAFEGHALAGDALCIFSAFLWGLGTNLQKPLVGDYSPLQVTLVMVTCGAIGLTILALGPALSMDWTSFTGGHALAVAGSGAVSIALGNVIWAAGVKALGPGRTANFGNLIPVFALLIAAAVLGEQVTLLQAAGAATVIAGVWYARR